MNSRRTKLRFISDIETCTNSICLLKGNLQMILPTKDKVWLLSTCNVN